MSSRTSRIGDLVPSVSLECVMLAGWAKAEPWSSFKTTWLIHDRGDSDKKNSRIKILGKDQNDILEKKIFLQIIDFSWRSHLQYLEQLRQVIGLRSYGQRDPLIEYKKEAFTLFENLLYKLKQDYITVLMNLKFVEAPKEQGQKIENDKSNFKEINKKIRRNDPCPCGSGKKYKKCCGSL